MHGMHGRSLVIPNVVLTLQHETYILMQVCTILWGGNVHAGPDLQSVYVLLF